MKLRNIYLLCEANYDSIRSLTGQNVTIDNRMGIKVLGWEAARNALLELYDVPSLKMEAQELFDVIPAFYRNSDTFNVSTDEWQKIASKRATLLRTMDDTIDLYKKMGFDTTERIGLDIKLPAFNDFSEFAKYISDIDFVLTKCPFLKEENESLVFENVDVGSTWLTFFVVGSAVAASGSIILNNIAAFIDKCIIIRSHFLTTQKQKADIEAQDRNEQEKEVILNYLQENYKKELDIAIKELEEVTHHAIENKDGDEYGRIEQCFDKMGKLLDKGLQIRSSIDSPSETKALFEPLETKYLAVENALKLLEKKEE